MAEPTPEQILSLNPAVPSGGPKKTSFWWTIFWLVGFTPIGWYFVWFKTNWNVAVKLSVTIVTAVLFFGLLLESELIATQLTSGLLM